jgi:hypothetical protein
MLGNGTKMKKIPKPCLIYPFKEHLTNEIAYVDGIIPSIYQVVDGKVSVDPARLEKLARHKFAVIETSHEHWGPTTGAIDMIYDIVKSTGMNFIQLVHDPVDDSTRPEYKYYPFYYYQTWKEFYYQLDVPDYPRKYKIGCMNGMCRPHRIYLWLELRKKSWFDQCYTTMHYNKFGRSPEDIDRPDSAVLPEESWNEWCAIRETLSNFEYGMWWDADNPAHTDSYLYIVTETTACNRLFLSEKVWKPLINMQLALIQGNPGSVALMRKHGIDMFDDIIDHSYDLELDWKKRTDMILAEADRLVKLDLEDIFKQTYHRRKSNQDLLRPENLNYSWHNYVVDQINQNK